MNHLMRMTGALALCLATTATAAGDLVEKVYHAAAAKDPARLELLLTQGFDPEALHNDRSPLHMAAWHGRLPAARLLLAHGVDVDIAQTGEGDGTTPLLNAAEGNRLEMVRFLIAAGADVNATNRTYRNSPLQRAAELASPEMAQILVEAGAEVNAGNIYNFTALHRAAKYNDAEMVDFLLDAGANPLARQHDPGHSDHGFMPLDDARKYNAKLLETDAGRRLARLTAKKQGCDGAIVLAGDTKLSILAERTLGKASRWKEIAKLNGLEGKGYKKGDCLALPKR